MPNLNINLKSVRSQKTYYSFAAGNVSAPSTVEDILFENPDLRNQIMLLIKSN
jgi:hypothetical protein